MAITTLPRGFHENKDGALICSHRDLSCCPDCRDSDVRFVDVLGMVMFVPTQAERDELTALLTA